MSEKDSPYKMPDEIRRQVETLTQMQKRYCEYRAKGLKQYEASEKAGSAATTKDNLGRVGCNIEQIPAAKEYINWLTMLRAQQACVDEIEVIEKVRAVYEQAMDAGKFGDANNAAKMLGEMIGVFGKNKTVESKSNKEKEKGLENDLSAFKEPEDSVEERARKLRALIKDVK